MAANARRAYSALVSEVLGAANTGKDLGRDFGADLTEAELRYLVRREWAVSAADILWRRTKVGLRLSQAAIASVDEYLKQLFADVQPAEWEGRKAGVSFVLDRIGLSIGNDVVIDDVSLSLDEGSAKVARRAGWGSS
jgi:glycerol-3-phosphate dehydrogenase